jgi:ribosomal protein L32
LTLSVITLSAQAQEAPRFDTLTIDLWPEYDRPDMLVIYKAELSPEVSLPANVTLRMPVEAGVPAVVAVGPDANSVADAVFETQVMGEWLEVSFIATTPVIQFEYYDPRLIKDGAIRNFDFTWPGDYKVDALILQAQQPLGAENLTVSPLMGRMVQDQVGFTYNIIEIGELEQGETFDIGVSYEKASDALSVESLQIQPSATITPGSSNIFNLDQPWVWFLIVLGVVLIGGGAYWYWRTGRQETEPQKRRQRRSSNVEQVEVPAGKAVYCHQCGKRARPGNVYCRTCGTLLRND